jgi:hypothetical protein
MHAPFSSTAIIYHLPEVRKSDALFEDCSKRSFRTGNCCVLLFILETTFPFGVFYKRGMSSRKHIVRHFIKVNQITTIHSYKTGSIPIFPSMASINFSNLDNRSSIEMTTSSTSTWHLTRSWAKSWALLFLSNDVGPLASQSLQMKMSPMKHRRFGDMPNGQQNTDLRIEHSTSMAA